MFKIDDKMNIEINRGDIATMEVKSIDEDTGEQYVFKSGDVVRFTVCEKDNYKKPVLIKDVPVMGETTVVDIVFSMEDTRFAPVLNKEKVYYYTVELNPDTAQQTLIGHDKKGAKLITVYPEGGDRIEP